MIDSRLRAFDPARLAIFAAVMTVLPALQASFAPDPGGFFPAAGAVQVCPDTPLRLRFEAPPALGTGGEIRVYDAANRRVVESIDVRAPIAVQTIGGIPNFKYLPVILEGNEAHLYLRDQALAYGKTYYVTVAAGTFTVNGQPFAGIADPAAWRFTTKSAPPAAGTARLTVAADGTGDFCTVQGAIDFLPDGNLVPTTLFLRRGTYTEIVAFANKHAITLRGEDRHRSVIAYANNARFNDGNAVAAPGAGAPPKRRSLYHRGVFLADHADNLVLANLTIRDTTPQGGSQAEAIILNGTPTSRAILKDVDLYSYQDTLQINGQAYLENCFIEGDVDFMWGKGPCFFENCVCRSLRSNAYYTQIRNPATNHGFVYLRCTFDGVRGVMGNYLARIGLAAFPNSEVVLLDCALGSSVSPAAWQLQGSPSDLAAPASIHFWEWNSRDLSGNPVDVSARLSGSRQLAQTADAELIADYANPVFVLGGAWDPRPAARLLGRTDAAAAPRPPGTPEITAQPASQLALLGTGALFSVAATGAGPLRYQWSRNGAELPGAISAVFRLAAVGWAEAGVYTVAVSNASGTAASAAAELIAVAPDAVSAPQLPRIPMKVYAVTDAGARSDGATDNTAAIQKTIDRAVAAGGGIVFFPAGPRPYLSGPIALGSRVNLQIDSGAILQALPYAAPPGSARAAYPLRAKRYANFLTAADAHDVALTGGGRIEGDGAPWWRAYAADRAMPHRPYLIRFDHCERVLVAGLTFANSPMFHVAMGAIDQLTVFGIKITSPESPNTDGVDPSGSHQLIQNCAIACGDDNIAVKAGGTFCSDITIADCAFGIGHGVSVGGQSDSGLDGMTVKNCFFDGTVSGLRLKADATQGGLVQNISYTNLVMHRVSYPIVFYSYYNRSGNPGAASGKNDATPEKVADWNQHPPNSLRSKTLPAWKNILISNLVASGGQGYNIIWGLPLGGYLIDSVKLRDVHIAGGLGFKIFDAADVQFTGATRVGPVIADNALAITRQPQDQAAAIGADATFSVETAGAGGTPRIPLRFQWNFNGRPIQDGDRGEGAAVSGAATAVLTLEKIRAAEAGKYSVTVSASLDGFDPAADAPAPASIPVSALSAAAQLQVDSAPPR